MNLRRVVPFFPADRWLQLFSVWGTLAVESGIPVLLVFRRTRFFGIALAAGFHYTLGVFYTGFSAMLFAMLALFAPPQLHAAAARGLAALRRRLPLPSGEAAARLRRRLDAAVTAGVWLAAGGVAIDLFARDAPRLVPLGRAWLPRSPSPWSPGTSTAR